MATVAPTPDDPAEPPVMLRKQSSHFNDDDADAGEDIPALYIYLLSQPEFSAGRVVAVTVVLFVMQLVLVANALGLGQWGNGCAFAIACMLVNWGILGAIWEEGKHVKLFEPGTRTFYGFAFAHMVVEAAAYGLQEHYLVPHDDDDTTEEKFQGSVIFAYFVRYIVAGVGVTYMLMFQAHKDPSPHLFRICFCVIAIGSFVNRLCLYSGVSALHIVGALVQVVFYLGAILVGMPLAIFKLSKGTGAEDVGGGTACLISIQATYTAVFAFSIAGMSTVPGVMKAAVLSGFTGMILSALWCAGAGELKKGWGKGVESGKHRVGRRSVCWGRGTMRWGRSWYRTSATACGSAGAWASVEWDLGKASSFVSSGVRAHVN